MSDPHVHRVFTSVGAPSAPPAALPRDYVLASWRRCLEEHRLAPEKVGRPHVLTRAELTCHRDPADELIAVARVELDRLFGRLVADDYLLLLTDAGGVAIDCRIAATHLPEARRASLMLGSVWDEANQGTNGTGTCIRVGRPVSIVRDDHFALHNISLTCTVAPIRGDDGQLLGVLDVSTTRASDHRHQRLILEMVKSAARRIESRCFRHVHRHRPIVQISSDGDFIDGADGCLLALDDDANVVALDPAARELLARLGLGDAGALPVEAVLSVDQRALAATAAGNAIELRCLTEGTDPLYARVDLPPPRPFRARQRRAAAAPDAPDLAALAGGDPRMLALARDAHRLVAAGLPILLLGEPGTGKGALAYAIHRAGPGSRGPFVAIDCAGLTEAQLESELFGDHERAVSARASTLAPGGLIAADGGTLFLDAVDVLPQPLQRRLARALGEGRMTPPGSLAPIGFDVATIAASTSPYGGLGAELHHRLAGAVLRPPALRERTDSRAVIAAMFAAESHRQSRPAKLATEALDLLAAYAWPGNLGELRHVARYAVALCDEPEITFSHLPDALTAGAGSPGQSPEGRALRLALDHCAWNVSAAARFLGVSRATLHRRIVEHGLHRPGSVGS